MASQGKFDYFASKTYCSTTGLISADLLDPEKRKVILWRAGLSKINVDKSLSTS